MTYECNNEVIMALKSNPKNFLQHNAVDIVHFPHTYGPRFNMFGQNHGIITKFDFTSLNVSNCCTYTGMIDLKGTVEAYYLPWQANTGYNLLLEDHADIMFTCKLEGCGFSYVRSLVGSAVRVSHHNIMGASEQEMNESLAFTGNKIVNSSQELHRNVIGVRERHFLSHRWVFYVQSFKLKSGARILPEIESVYTI